MKKIYLTIITLLSVIQFSQAQWSTSGTNIYYNTGNVGIGNNSPTFNLDVTGIFRTTGNITTPSVNNQYIGYGSNPVNNSFAVGTSVLNGTSNTGTANIAVGANVLSNNTTGYANVGVGSGTLFSNTTGFQNIGIGGNTQRYNTTGYDNIAIGYLALENNIAGNGSIAIGTNALTLATGRWNTSIGWYSGSSLTTGTGNTFVGDYAGTGVTGSNNTILGGNTIVGPIGLTSGSNNTIIGANLSGISPTLANYIILADGSGNQRLTIDNNGNTGVGTSTPGALFSVGSSTVRGTVSVTGTATGAPVIGLTDTKTGGHAYSLYSGLSAAGNFDLLDQNAGAYRLTVNSSGNVGIGTITPAAKLDVNGVINTPSYMSATDGFFLETTADGIDNSAGSGYLSFRSNNVANRMVISPVGNVGIGTTTPGAALTVVNNIPLIQLFDADANPQDGSSEGRLAFGSAGSEYASIGVSRVGTNDDDVTTLQFKTSYATGVGGDGNNIERMRINYNGNVGIGTTTPQYKLDVYGAIHSRQVNVDLSGTPDYVFNKDYRLPTLTETEAYIAQNHHLAEIPSADEIAKNGLNLGEMNKMLLKKVEELTLYLIEKDKQVNEQQKINQAFREQLNDLTEQLKALKAYGSPKSIK